MTFPTLDQPTLIAIAQALADTSFGFSGPQLSQLISKCGFRDVDPQMTKYKRLFNAFCDRINRDKSTNCVMGFIQEAMKPAYGINDQQRHETRRFKVNEALMLHGLSIDAAGNFIAVAKASTLSEVQRRTRELRQKLTGYNAHRYVLRCCSEELLQENYFHAVFEASKSLLDRLREMTGLTSDGTALIDAAFGGNSPILAINSLRTSSEKNQQNGLREMINGVFHMMRNVTAHELKIRWDINEKDAVDALTMISILHGYLDQCIVIPTCQATQ